MDVFPAQDGVPLGGRFVGACTCGVLLGAAFSALGQLWGECARLPSSLPPCLFAVLVLRSWAVTVDSPIFPCSSSASFHALKHSVTRCRNVKGCCDLLISWLRRHYEITHHLMRNPLSDSSRAVPAHFSLTAGCCVSSRPFSLWPCIHSELCYCSGCCLGGVCL